ncbi:hypothetical protein SDC9_74022 [bioreactor metagenome]|uniref:Uncharacterized protein n=1 Tax=bioreactor metagenome TaxID=1076179 RepID=A0A644YGD2_9ZZZZ
MRFKTINTPLLIKKVILSAIIIVLSIVQAIIFRGGDYPWYFLLLSLGALATAVQLGMLGKHLINVILPGTLVLRGAKKQTKTAEPVKKPKMSPEEIARLVQEKQAAKARAEKENEANDAE